jgi:hypothetical protein
VNYYFLTLLVACTLYALWAGGAPERIGASVYALSVAATFLIVPAPDHPPWLNLEVGAFVIDAATFIAFIAIALRANRYWPLWVAAFLGIGVLGHVAKLMVPDTFWRAYAVVLTIWSYPILALMVIGALRHRQRLARAGADRSWVSSSDPSGPMPMAGPTAS